MCGICSRLLRMFQIYSAPKRGVDLKSGKTLANNAFLSPFSRFKIARRSALQLALHPAWLEPAIL